MTGESPAWRSLGYDPAEVGFLARYRARRDGEAEDVQQLRAADDGPLDRGGPGSPGVALPAWERYTDAAAALSAPELIFTEHGVVELPRFHYGLEAFIVLANVPDDALAAVHITRRGAVDCIRTRLACPPLAELLEEYRAAMTQEQRVTETVTETTTSEPTGSVPVEVETPAKDTTTVEVTDAVTPAAQPTD